MKNKNNFSAGFTIGTSVLGGELVVFFGRMIIEVFQNSTKYLNLNSNSMANIENIYGISTMTLGLFSIVGLIQGIVIGYKLPESMVFGYILGVCLILVIYIYGLSAVIPSVEIGIIISLFSPIIGLIMKYRYMGANNYW